ncbi:MAG TPA: pyrimidine reductase family protein [Pseudonocardia sp.]|jgi:5-amino-6-(5-phosphoribosylamino)uracil reductase
MFRLWPPADTPTGEPGPSAGTTDAVTREVTDERLAEWYAYPAELDRPYLRVNFVAAADGAVAVAGRSGGLSSAADRRVFGLLRELAEVVVVGAQTARAENYRGARKPSRVTGRPPTIAVVTASGRLDPAAPLFTDTAVPPLVVAAAGADRAALDRLVGAGAEVAVLDGDRVGPAALVAELDRRGFRRVLCEGGPGLFGDLIAADAVDELCLTVAPLLAGGTAGRIARGPDGESRGMRLAGALAEEGALLLRYLRERDADGPPAPTIG